VVWLTLPYASDTDFQHFAAWVVAQGQNVHSTLCKHPERLLEVLEDLFPDDPFPYSEGLCYVPTAAYSRRTGAEWLPARSLDIPQLWCMDFQHEEVALLMPELWQRQNREQVQGLDLTAA
jgi:hypothetical protein